MEKEMELMLMVVCSRQKGELKIGKLGIDGKREMLTEASQEKLRININWKMDNGTKKVNDIK